MSDEKKSSIGVILGVALATLVSSGAFSSWIGVDIAQKKEMSITNHIDNEFKPRVEQAFESIDDDLDAIEEDLIRCQVEIRQAKIMAESALALIEKRMSARTVERVVARVAADEPKTEPPPRAEMRKPRVEFHDYVQQKMGD